MRKGTAFSKNIQKKKNINCQKTMAKTKFSPSLLKAPADQTPYHDSSGEILFDLRCVHTR